MGYAATTREITQSRLPDDDGEEAKRGTKLSRKPDFVITIASPKVMTDEAVKKYEESVGCDRTLHIKTEQDPVLSFPQGTTFFSKLRELKRPCDVREIMFRPFRFPGSILAHRSEAHIIELNKYFKKKKTQESTLGCCDPNRASTFYVDIDQ